MTTTAHDLPKQSQRQRSKRIELAIVPGRSLGPFRLGSSLWDNLNFLLEKSQYFPSVELKYSSEDPLLYDFIIALPYNGLHLRYDGSLQRLKSIECYDPSKVKLVYQNNDVSSSRTIPTFLLIYKSFGPTYPGEFDASQSVYTLKYPGLAFTFPIPTKHTSLYKSSSDLPLEFPDGTTPIASKVILYSNSNSWQQASTPSLPKVIAESNASKSTRYGKIERREVESVIAKPDKGITLVFPTISHSDTGGTNKSNNQSAADGSSNLDEAGSDSNSSEGGVNKNSISNTVNTFIHNRTVSIQLHVSTPQDILAELGKPSRIFYKEEDKMKIHSNYDHNNNSFTSNSYPFELSTTETATLTTATTLDDKGAQPTDYFFNYFHLGIDILIDGALHVCKKIVLHGNIPGHYDFQKYKRCPFQITFPKKQKKNKKDTSILVDVYVEDEEIITADMKIQTIQERIPWNDSNIIKENGQKKPVILTRGSSEQNPFGSTYLTGNDQGIVMEVMKNGCVPTVVLF
ncbi:hypothetical protein CU097_000398 [Rhizopus azygosporus]|uniref:Uncharacterized protein n=1 Tax=Rhizopus azygosporus TaxID=86630 RepID=A0A367IS23_RHIAZ|nr:hypothetical protein CU097_000398 [Rhizopus azygosporus]